MNSYTGPLCSRADLNLGLRLALRRFDCDLCSSTAIGVHCAKALHPGKRITGISWACTCRIIYQKNRRLEPAANGGATNGGSSSTAVATTSGGSPSVGGGSSAAGIGTAGLATSPGGGTSAAGGSATGGATADASGGALGTGGSSPSGSAYPTGGAAATGGVRPTGGANPTGGAAATGGALGIGGSSALSAIQQACATDCGIMTGAANLASCQLTNCPTGCASAYASSAVAGINGCQAAFLAVLQCGAGLTASHWTCYGTVPAPSLTSTCSSKLMALSNVQGCLAALQAAMN